MNVAALISKLKEYDPQAEVCCTWEGVERGLSVYRHKDGRVMINGDGDSYRDNHIGSRFLKPAEVVSILLDGGTVVSGSKGLGSERCDVPDFKFFDPDLTDEQLKWLDLFLGAYEVDPHGNEV